MIDYKLLEAFAMVILEGGFEKAARRLYLTQSAVSQRVKQLEDQVGAILLKRTTPPEPTDSGLPFLTHYRKVAQLEAEIMTTPTPNNSHSITMLAIGINADTLETWFYQAISTFLDHHAVSLDLHVDDQDRTEELLRDGKVWGCISTRSQPLQGCKLDYLGWVKYGLFAAPGFRQYWFPNGLSLENFSRAPMARFNRKDELNNQMFQLLFERLPTDPPTFYVPSTNLYGHFVKEGRCWGILPEQQSRELEEQGKIINLCPEQAIKIKLFWHSWNLRSNLMDSFTNHLRHQAKAFLRQE
jgi:LysR family transcriptional regulator (chromosome initiation inhibitor)